MVCNGEIRRREERKRLMSVLAEGRDHIRDSILRLKVPKFYIWSMNRPDLAKKGMTRRA